MKITTLGTSHGNHTYCRFNSSTLIESGSSCYLMDAGSPVDALLTRRGTDFNRLKAIFISHMHADHVAGVPNLIKYITKFSCPDRGQTSIFLPEETIAPLKAWCAAMHLSVSEELFRLCVTREGRIYQDAALCVTSHRTCHMEMTAPGCPSYAYHVQCEGKNILFTGDLDNRFSDFPVIALDKKFDVIFCEATHYPPEKAIPILMKAQTQKLVFYHIHDPWHGEGEERLLAHYQNLPYPVAVAHDGDEFIL